MKKTHYLLINRQCNFSLVVNIKVITRIQNVKYLGVIIDNCLNWSSHIKQLSLQMARYSGVLYRYRRNQAYARCMLYYSLIQSRLQNSVEKCYQYGFARNTIIREAKYYIGRNT